MAAALLANRAWNADILSIGTGGCWPLIRSAAFAQDIVLASEIRRTAI